MSVQGMQIVRLRKLFAALRSFTFMRALVGHRVLAGVEHAAVLRGGWGTIVDIGANRGQFALAAREWARARVYSFEPLKEARAVFGKVLGHDDSVRLFPFAIGPRSESRSMYVAGRDDSSSLLEIGARQVALFPGTGEVGQELVEMRRLNDVISDSELVAPVLLKLDVQGFEFEALLGCAQALHAIHSVYCECSFVELYTGQKLAAEVVKLLAEHGFGLAGVYNVTYDRSGMCVQADLLFSRAGIC